MRVLNARGVRDAELIRRGQILQNMRSYKEVNPDFMVSVDLPPVESVPLETFDNADHGDVASTGGYAANEDIDVTRPLYPDMEDASRKRKQLVEVKRVTQRCASIVKLSEKTPNFTRIVHEIKEASIVPSERKLGELRMTIDQQNAAYKKLRSLNDDKGSIQSKLEGTKAKKKVLASTLKQHESVIADTRKRLQKAIDDLNALTSQSKARSNQIMEAIRGLEEGQGRLRYDIADVLDEMNNAEREAEKLESSIEVSRGKKKDDLLRKKETLKVTAMQAKQTKSLLEAKISALEEEKATFRSEKVKHEKDQATKARAQMKKISLIQLRVNQLTDDGDAISRELDVATAAVGVVKASIESTSKMAKEVKSKIDAATRNIEEIDYMVRKNFQGGEEDGSSGDNSDADGNDAEKDSGDTGPLDGKKSQSRKSARRSTHAGQISPIKRSSAKTSKPRKRAKSVAAKHSPKKAKKKKSGATSSEKRSKKARRATHASHLLCHLLPQKKGSARERKARLVCPGAKNRPNQRNVYKKKKRKTSKYKRYLRGR